MFERMTKRERNRTLIGLGALGSALLWAALVLSPEDNKPAQPSEPLLDCSTGAVTSKILLPNLDIGRKIRISRQGIEPNLGNNDREIPNALVVEVIGNGNITAKFGDSPITPVVNRHFRGLGNPSTMTGISPEKLFSLQFTGNSEEDTDSHLLNVAITPSATRSAQGDTDVTIFDICIDNRPPVDH